jgi:hypothetical protein
MWCEFDLHSSRSGLGRGTRLGVIRYRGGLVEMSASASSGHRRIGKTSRANCWFEGGDLKNKP